MAIERGEKVHVITRRRFEGDVRRHFVGEVAEANDSLIRVVGYQFIFDSARNEFERQPEERVRIISLADSGNVVSVLPSATRIDQLRYELSDERQLIMTDGDVLNLDFNEFGPKR